jgi:hypothetical protein
MSDVAPTVGGVGFGMTTDDKSKESNQPCATLSHNDSRQSSLSRMTMATYLT